MVEEAKQIAASAVPSSNIRKEARLASQRKHRNTTKQDNLVMQEIASKHDRSSDDLIRGSEPAFDRSSAFSEAISESATDLDGRPSLQKFGNIDLYTILRRTLC